MKNKFKIFFRRAIVRHVINLAISFLIGLTAWEKQMAEQDTCKHEGMEGKKFCGDCGKTLISEDENLLRGVLTSILTEHGVIKPKKAASAPGEETLAQRLTRKKK